MNRIPSQIRHDYKTMLEPAGPRRRSRRLPWLAVVAASAIAVVALMSTLLGAAFTARDAVRPTNTAAAPALLRESQVKTEKIAVAQPAQSAQSTQTDADIVSRALALPPPGGAAAPAEDYVAPGSADAASAALSEAVVQPEEIAATRPAPAPPQKNPPQPALARTSPADTDLVRQALALPAPNPAVSFIEDPTVADDQSRLELVIQPGDTLDELFADNGLSRADLARLLRLQQVRQHLQLLRPGDRIVVSHRDGRITGLQRPLDEQRTLQIERTDNGYTASIAINAVERRQARAHGVIESSLFRAAQDAGISDNLIMNLAGVFAWDIDFVLDIRAGDRFVVVFEEIWQDGEKLRNGEILAAEFTNQGRTYRAIRFTDPSGDSDYFTPDGLNVRKAFLRAPIAITPRVTSSFNPRRLHPVHGRVRPHKGVDYGAPTGTPIKAAGDGKVIFRGSKGGYGKTVILQHGGNITTLYAHMSRFHKRSKSGNRVKQGQIIGYVGATGTVTARHLHYEYRVNGVHRNPRTVKLPEAKPVDARYRSAFEATASPLLQQLHLVQRAIRLAEGEPPALD